MAHEPIRESIAVHAPIERCWALSGRVELVQKTLGMQLAGGVTQGSISAGSRVVWSGWKFGLPTVHHTRISRFEPPHSHFVRLDAQHEITKEAFFRDEQEKGRFAEFHHDHFFREEMDGKPITVLTDEVHFRLPFGFFGELVAKFVMGPYIRTLARRRFAMIKELAEGEGWRAWVEEGVIMPASHAEPEPASHLA